MKKAALVISGGGCKGAFAVGAVQSIYKRYRKDGWFAIVGGSSTGAIIAPLAALLGAPDPLAHNAYRTMLYFYSHVTTKRLLERKSIKGMLQRQNSFNTLSPLRELIERLFIPECFEWLQSEEAPDCYVVYVNYRTARKVFVSPKDPGIKRGDFIQAMLASVSVPVFIEPTIIEGDVCYDGGLRDVIPFGKAVDLGAETILPVFLHPDGMDESDDEFKRLGKVLQRTMFIMMDETLRNDYEIARLTNLGVQARNELLGTLRGKSRKKAEEVLNKSEYGELFGGTKRIINIITGIRPDFTLTEESLAFEPTKMRSWISMGEKKADEVLLESPFTEIFAIKYILQVLLSEAFLGIVCRYS